MVAPWRRKGRKVQTSVHHNVRTYGSLLVLKGFNDFMYLKTRNTYFLRISIKLFYFSCIGNTVILVFLALIDTEIELKNAQIDLFSFGIHIITCLK